MEICIDPKQNEYTLIYSIGFGKSERFFVEKISDQINKLLEHLVDHPTDLVRSLPILTPNEEKNYKEWNNTYREYTKNRMLHEIFIDCAKKYSSNIAINCEGNILTYKQLDSKTNQLAHYIKKQLEIKPDTLVVLCLDRDEYLLQGLLAVLKSGGAYVPIDPDYPDERIDYIVRDTNTKLILTNNRHKKRLKNVYIDDKNCPKIIELDSQEIQKEIIICPTNIPEIETSCKNLAYVIYTSGTTGKPKGVMIEHRNIINLVLSLQEILEISHEDNFLFYRSYVFDGVIEETILPLTVGAKVNICKFGIKDLPTFFDTIKRNNVSIININSETIQALGDSFCKGLNIKKIIAGGTKFNTDSFSSLLKQNITIFNSYGPTDRKNILWKDITYEKLASYYITYMKSIQSRGPYNFLVGVLVEF